MVIVPQHQIPLRTSNGENNDIIKGEKMLHVWYHSLLYFIKSRENAVITKNVVQLLIVATLVHL